MTSGTESLRTTGWSRSWLCHWTCSTAPGIDTYVWVLTNRKSEQRRGRVQLIDATGWNRALHRDLGKKNCELGEDDIARVSDTFLAFEETEHNRIFDNADFGYWKITVEQPCTSREWTTSRSRCGPWPRPWASLNRLRHNEDNVRMERAMSDDPAPVAPVRSTEVIFEVTDAAEGGYDARALGYGIFTQGEDWDDLKSMVRDAVLCHFDGAEVPRVVRLHLVRDEVLAAVDRLVTS